MRQFYKMAIKCHILLISHLILLLGHNCDKEVYLDELIDDQIDDKLTNQRENVINEDVERNLWRLFQDYADLNGYLNRTQLATCVKENLVKVHERSLKDEIKENYWLVNGKISYEGYFRKVFGDEIYDEYDARPAYLDRKLDEFVLVYMCEKNRWHYLSDELSSLDLAKFYSFSYPNEFELTRINDARFIFNYYNLNQNHVIEFNELNDAIKENRGYLLIDDYEQIVKSKRYPKSIDKNGDNQLDLIEFADWIMPSIDEAIRKDVNIIFVNVDSNNDSLLSRQEIISKVILFKKFEFTNFGEYLRANKVKHDEL